MKRYHLTGAAEADLREIGAYVREQAGARVAAGVVRRIRAAVRDLGDMPGSGHRREDVAPAGLSVRFVSVFNYMIVYRADARPVQVLRILHGARDIGAILADEGDQG